MVLDGMVNIGGLISHLFEFCPPLFNLPELSGLAAWREKKAEKGSRFFCTWEIRRVPCG